MENPTVIVGQTQSGKTFRAFRLFEVHDGPAIFYDTQWRGRDYLADRGGGDGGNLSRVVRASSFDSVRETLVAWREGDAPPRIVFEPVNHDDFALLVDALIRVHLVAHIEDRRVPKLALFVDEISLLAGRSADAGNAAVRLFTQGYQHKVIGVAITQRPALTTRNIIEQAWEAYIFSPGPVGAKVLEDYGWVPPDWSWVTEPRSYHYWRYNGNVWLKGDAGGVEIAVAEVPEVQSDTESPLPPSDDRGPEDMEGVGKDGVPAVRPDIQPGASP